MFEVVPYEASHLQKMSFQRAQKHLEPYVTEEIAKALEQCESVTGMHYGEPVICAGLIHETNWRAIAWAYLGEAASRCMASVHRAACEFLGQASVRRIEATCDIEFEQGHRWLMMLGFDLEAHRMRAYRADGGDSSLYARLNYG